MIYQDVLSIVTSFYAKATQDILIGFHFRNIKDFDQHLPRIADFWEYQVLGTQTHPESFPFDLIRVHLPLKLNKGQLRRWIILFDQTLQEFVATHPHEKTTIAIWAQKIEHFKNKMLDHPKLFHS